MAYPGGYWAELVRSSSSTVLTEDANGFYIWLRTSDGLPLEQQQLDNTWQDIADDTGEPDYLSVLNARFFRFRKRGEAWIPSDNGVSLSGTNFAAPHGSVPTYRFFTQPLGTAVDVSAGDDKTVASGGTVTLDGSVTVLRGSGDTTYAWARVSGAGGALSAANVAQPDFTAPVLAFGAANREIVWRVTATNNGVSDTDDVTVTVEAPQALSAPNFADDTGDAAAWTRGTAIAAITVPAATGNPAPTYAVVGALPAGIAFDPATREITGTPTGTGNGTIRIRATNSQGNDDWTFPYATVAPPPRQDIRATFTIGDGGTGNNLYWAEGNHGTIPGRMLVDGLNATLANLLIGSTGIFQMQTKRGGFGAQTGPEMIALWETFEAATVIEAGGNRLALPGPNAPGNVFNDAAEPYSANVGSGHGQAAFIAAYKLLTPAQRAATTITFQTAHGDPILTPLTARAQLGRAVAVVQGVARALTARARLGSAIADVKAIPDGALTVRPSLPDDLAARVVAVGRPLTARALLPNDLRVMEGPRPDGPLTARATLGRAIALIEPELPDLVARPGLGRAIAWVEPEPAPLTARAQLGRAVAVVQGVARALIARAQLGRAVAVVKAIGRPLTARARLGSAIGIAKPDLTPLTARALLGQVLVHDVPTPDGPLTARALLGTEAAVVTDIQLGTVRQAWVDGAWRDVSPVSMARALRILRSDVTANDGEIEANAQAITRLRAEVQNNIATAVETLTARVTANQNRLDVEASKIVDIQAVIPGLATASAFQILEARVSLAEDVEGGTVLSQLARWLVKTTVAGLTGGVGLLNDGSSVKFTVTADKFAVVPPGTPVGGIVPFSVRGGVVYLNNASIETASLSGVKLINETMVGDKLVTSTITGNKIANFTIVGTKVAPNAISTTKILDATIINNDIQNGTITGAKIQGGTILGAKIGSRTISAGHIVRTTITGAEIANSTITGGAGGKIAGNTIQSFNIQDGTITGADIRLGTIDGTKLANVTIEGTKIAPNSISTTHIIAATITGSDIRDGTITGTKIVTGTIPRNFADLEGLIGAADIAAGAIIAGKFAANAIHTADIAANAVRARNIFFDGTQLQANTAGALSLNPNAFPRIWTRLYHNPSDTTQVGNTGKTFSTPNLLTFTTLVFVIQHYYGDYREVSIPVSAIPTSGTGANVSATVNRSSEGSARTRITRTSTSITLTRFTGSTYDGFLIVKQIWGVKN